MKTYESLHLSFIFTLSSSSSSSLCEFEWLMQPIFEEFSKEPTLHYVIEIKSQIFYS